MTSGKLLTIDDALNLSHRQVVELHKEYLNAGLAKMLSMFKVDRHFVKAEGIRVWDSEGGEYLDFLCSYGALSLGHNHPKVIDAVRKAAHLPNLLQSSLNPVAGALASNLATITPGDLTRSFFCNSGSEAIEGAIKLARIATGRTNIVCAEEGFHGKTLGALSATGHEKYRTPYKPLVPGFFHMPFGSLPELEQLLSMRDVAGVILEPIQGPAGILVPPEGYLKGVRELCTKYGSLLILDEIQTGFGRTGKMFACEHDNVVPDVLCLSKALGGGIYPIGAYITTDAIWKKSYGSFEKCLFHTSTFGGNTLACAAGLAAIQVIVEEHLVERAGELGEYFFGRLNEIQGRSKLLKEVRGKGLLIGLDFHQEKGVVEKLTGGLEVTTAALIAAELLNRHNIICLYTFNNPNVIRLAPPLNTDKVDIDRMIESLGNVLDRSKSFMSLALKAAGNLLR